MKARLATLLATIALLLAIPVGHAFASDPGLTYVSTFQSGATALGNGSPVDVAGLAGEVIQLSGMTSATITFEANVDGVNWFPVPAYNISTGAVGVTATASGLYFLNTSGYQNLRARISTYVSGTITATGSGVVVASSLSFPNAFTYTNVTTGTVTVKATSGTLHTISVNTKGASGKNLQCFDNTAASGTSDRKSVV